jgi:hypothetical protein
MNPWCASCEGLDSPLPSRSVLRGQRPGTDGLRVVEGLEKIRRTSAIAAALDAAIDEAAG